MADEHAPLPPTPSPPQSGSQAITSAPANGQVNPPPPGPASPPPGHLPLFPGRSELTQFAGWVAGWVLVLVCGYGGMALLAYLAQKFDFANLALVLETYYVLSLGMFLLLERDHWLSRLMGLRIAPNSRWWVSALLFWFLGPVLLLFRSTGGGAPPGAVAAPAPSPGARPAVNGRPLTQGQGPQADSTREIVETVVFVVVLVLMLKSFAAEAFVIPTGSMAQTLLGYNKVVECPQCGVKFPVNCSSEVDPSEGPPSRVVGCTCPNCRQHIHLRDPNGPDDLSGPPPLGTVTVDDPRPQSGDRVLVAKFVYGLVNPLPDRLDVVVFKFPGDDKFPVESGPVKRHVPMNYIKRLIGLPQETIAICRGKLYYLSAEKGLSYDDYEKALRDPSKMAQFQLWRKEHMHRDDERALERFKGGEFQIIRKKPDNILAMRRPVYDNDRHAKDLKGPEWERWVSEGEGWVSDGKHGFKADPAEEETCWLRYRHVLRGEKDRKQLITDFMGYNTWQAGRGHSSPGENWASDLILECDATVERPEGELTLELSRGPERFQAAFDLKSGRCTLYRVKGLRKEDERREELGSAEARVSRKGTYRLRFANVDERLTVWVDNRLPFEDGVVYRPGGELRPTEENDLNRPASVGSKGAKVAVSRIQLFRDTYYTTAQGGQPSAADIPDFKPDDPKSWSKPPVATFYVQPGHFLCLGDNSPESSDGRSWGLVPRRLLLGRALLVYYPFQRAGRIR